MKAMIYGKYGPPEVLGPGEVEKPVPGAGDVLIRVRAATVAAADYKIRGFDVTPAFWLPARLAFGLTRPKRKVLGTELAGVVEAVGRDVENFVVGDEVFGVDSSRFGAYAQYARRPADGALAVKPANMTFEEAAALPFGALVALYFLRDRGKIRSGHRVLINGASGGVGTAAVQLASYFGARVTGVCSTANLGLVKSLGADDVIDYTREDFTRGGRLYDIIFDTVGKTSYARCRNSLAPQGSYLLTVFGLSQLFRMLITSVTGGRKVICAIAPERKEDLLFVRDLAEAGRIRPVIDRRYPLDQAAEAHRYAEKGHKRGSVVLAVGLGRGDSSV